MFLVFSLVFTLALIVGAIFSGLDAKDGGARGTEDIRAA